jgi:NAD(P)-dependent dehydrogenase (short-subunit alcohol dehydrogenase family)
VSNFRKIPRELNQGDSVPNDYSKDTSLEGKVALITGGGAGIGRGIAIALAYHGASVVIAEIDPARAEQTRQIIEANGGKATIALTDVMDTDQIRGAVDAALSTFGQLDILINNAGGVAGRNFLDQSERSWRRHIDINLVSMIAATHAAAQVMVEGGRGGNIVNITSIEGSRAAPKYAVYAACKAGMINFTRTMALELSEFGIRVNCLAPDMTITPGLRGQMSGPVDDDALRLLPNASAQDIKGYIPLGREGNIADLGNAAVFLCSDMASYITGATIPVDGGTWASSGWTRTEDRSGWRLQH